MVRMATAQRRSRCRRTRVVKASGSPATCAARSARSSLLSVTSRAPVPLLSPDVDLVDDHAVVAVALQRCPGEPDEHVPGGHRLAEGEDHVTGSVEAARGDEGGAFVVGTVGRANLG